MQYSYCPHLLVEQTVKKSRYLSKTKMRIKLFSDENGYRVKKIYGRSFPIAFITLDSLSGTCQHLG